MAVIAIGALALLGAAAPASAEETLNPFPAEVIDTVGEFFDQYGVPEETQRHLIATAQSGGRWESMTTNALPMSTEVEHLDGADVTVNRFGDGSVSVVTLERPGSASAISGCSRSGTAYSNCKVDFWYGLVSMSFRADYNLAPGNNRITNQWGAAWSLGGACSTNRNYFGRPNSRVARLEVKAQVCGVPYSTTFYLELALSGKRATYNYG